MTTTRWFRNIGSGRGNPRRPARPPWRGSALAVVALMAIGQAGCSSLGIGNNCGTTGCGPVSRLGSRIGSIGSGCSSCGLLGGHKWFNRAPVINSYEPGIIAAPAVEAAPGPVIQGPGVPLLPAPPAAPADEVPQLEPAEPAPPGTAPQSRNGEGGAVKSVYETSAPRVGIGPARRGADPLNSTLGSGSIGRSSPRGPSPVDEVLSELPPITATMGGDRAPASSLPEEAGPAPADPVAAKTGGASAPSPALAVEPPPQPTAASLGAAPGIARFKVVKPGLAGGAVPTADGWAWLASLGYRAVLDLRERAEVQPADLAAIDQNGLIRVSLPVSPSTLDEKRLEQFENLLAQQGLRPLYFFDTEGARAAALWYVHQVVTGQVDSQEAAHEAEEVGTIDQKYWVAATALLSRRQPSPTPTPTPSAADPEPPNVPATDDAPAAATPPQADAAPAQTLAVTPAPAAVPEPVESQAPPVSRDPTAWRPYAAMILTGLGVPLAFFGRTALVNLGASVRASLPGPARPPKSLPSESGG